MLGRPMSMEDHERRIDELENHIRSLWALLADAYAFRDEKNFADFLLGKHRGSGSMIDARAIARLQAMTKLPQGAKPYPVKVRDESQSNLLG